MVVLNGLLSTLKIRKPRHSGLDPESHQTLKDDPSFRYIKEILNRVQDDENPNRSEACRHYSLFGALSNAPYPLPASHFTQKELSDDPLYRILL